MTKSAHAILFCTIVLLPAALQAHDEDVPVREDTLREVVVSAARTVYRLDTPTPVQTLRGRELRRLGGLSVADAIRYFSGVQLKDYGGVGGLKSVNIRSMGAAHTGVFYDGIELGNALNGQIDLGKYSLDNMEAVSLYNGQKSDMLQPAKDFGAAGSIYLNTAQPVFREGQSTRLRAGYRTTLYAADRFPVSYGLTNPSLLWQQRISRRVSSSLNAEWLRSDGRYLFRERVLNADGSVAYDTSAMRENSDVQALRVEGGLNGTLHEGEWKVKAYYYRSERGLPGATVRNSYWRDERLWDNDLFVQGYLQKRYGRYRSRLSAKYDNSYMRYVNRDKASLQVDNSYRQQEVYLSSANVLDLTSLWNVALSVDLQNNRLDADIDRFAYPRRTSIMAVAATAISLPQLKAQASLLATSVHDRLQAGDDPSPLLRWSPAVSASAKPFAAHDLHLRAFYKSAFRMPSFNELYYTVVGQAFLKPENTVQCDIGVTWEKSFAESLWQRISLQVDAYHNRVSDKIVATPSGNFFRWTMRNLGKVEIWGADIALHGAIRWQSLFIKANINYTWQQAQDRTNATDRYYGHQIPYTPRHSGSAVVSIDYRRWSFNYSFIYVGERYDQQENIAVNHLQPWYTSDCSLQRTFTLWGAEIKLSAEVCNLFNQYYAVITNYPMPGRHLKIGCYVEL